MTQQYFFDFGKNKRLLKAKDFKFVFDNAFKKIHSPSFLLIIARSTSSTPRIGLAITKKKYKKACDRNHIKRHTREFFRLNQHHLSAIDCVLVAKKQCNKEDIAPEIFEIFEKLKQL